MGCAPKEVVLKRAEEIQSLVEQGYSAKQIAEKIGMSVSNVYRYIKGDRAGVSKSKVNLDELYALLDQGLSKCEVGRRLGISDVTVGYHAKCREEYEGSKQEAQEPPKEPVSASAAVVAELAEALEIVPSEMPKISQKRKQIETSLFDFAFVPYWGEQLRKLANLAAPEPWRFKSPTVEYKYPETAILESYILQSFKRRAVEYNETQDDLDRVICFQGDFCYFHTGLYTQDYRNIYMCFNRNPAENAEKEWIFADFADEASAVLKYATGRPEHRTPGLELATLFNPTMQIRVNWAHILEDPENVERLPQFVRDFWNPLLLLETAMESARRRAFQSPHTVVIVPKPERPTYLLPIYLMSPTKPDLVGVLENVGGYYLCRTCLTLEQAYLNARNYGRIGIDWLKTVVKT